MRLAWFPPTFSRDLNDKNGVNWPFLAFVDRSAPDPTSIAAQEIREALYKGYLATGAAIVIGVVGYIILSYFSLPWWPLIYPMMLCYGLTGMPFIKRKVELKGQSTESVARRAFYGYNIETSLLGNARQLKRSYSQFDDWTEEEILEGLRKEVPKSEKWVAGRYNLLEKIKRKIG